MEINRIATIYTDFPRKFGLPRQAGLAPSLRGRIVMEKEFRRAEAFRGLEGFSHIWLIWGFSESAGQWQPTVRPPRLGGNVRVGAFASRSPFRPNGLGMSAVKLERRDYEAEDGPVLYVSGIDMVSGTPVYDIKPYLSYADSIPEASGGFTRNQAPEKKAVVCPEEVKAVLAPAEWAGLEEALALDPRPSYQQDPARVYGFPFGGREVRFRASEQEIQVLSIGEEEGV